MQNLEKMRLSLINAQNQKSRFIMGISHDIRTPISIIKGYTEALSDGFLTGPEETKNGLDIISQKTQELEGITETLIDYMRMDLNELTEQLEPINAREVFHLFAKSSELTMPIYNRNYTYNIDIPENITILANKNLLLRALDNLFTNALHYTKNHDKIHFDAHLEDKCIKLSLEDSGIGMEKNELNNIFNIFYRGQNTNKQKGLGIGLTVVHDIVEIHKWKISCESEKGKGTTFFITIPLESYSDK
ncbi:MAG: HAMP domain-containing histidine kinase [Treponema sp.]|nr:HAMP domain-containing histidine kinase [Treponema sp.]